MKCRCLRVVTVSFRCVHTGTLRGGYQMYLGVKLISPVGSGGIALVRLLE
jgi:hypothetical protein